MRPLTLKKVFTLRSTPGFLVDLHAAADAAGMTASDFIRESVNDRIQGCVRKRREDRSTEMRAA